MHAFQKGYELMLEVCKTTHNPFAVPQQLHQFFETVMIL